MRSDWVDRFTLWFGSLPESRQRFIARWFRPHLRLIFWIAGERAQRRLRARVRRPLPASGPPPSREELERIVDDYFEAYRFLAGGRVDERPKELDDVSFWIDELAHYDPERLWPILLELVDRASDDQIHFVAAGPLEDLVTYHGLRFLDRLEERAIADERFHTALRGVWGWDHFPREVRTRLFAVLTPEWIEPAAARSSNAATDAV